MSETSSTPPRVRRGGPSRHRDISHHAAQGGHSSPCVGDDHCYPVSPKSLGRGGVRGTRSRQLLSTLKHAGLVFF